MATSEIYPTVLPPPRTRNYRIQPGENVLRTEMETGAARQRRQSLGAPSTIPCEFLYTNVQYAIFESWYETKADEGATFFTIFLRSGLGYVEHEARFKGQPQPRLLSGRTHWVVTAELEIRKRPILSEEALDLALSEDLSGLLAAIDGLHSGVQSHLATNAAW